MKCFALRGECWFFQVEIPFEDALDVDVNDGHRCVVGEGGDRSCGVGSDTGELLELEWRFRNNTFVVIHDMLCEGMEVDGASVVAEACPCVDDVGGCCFCEFLDRGKLFKECIVFWDDAVNLRLLEHEFGNENVVRRCCLAPGEVAFVLCIPGEDGGLECLLFFVHTVLFI